MIKNKIWNKKKEISLNKKIDNDIKISWKKAMNDPYPLSDATLKYVFSKRNNEK